MTDRTKKANRKKDQDTRDADCSQRDLTLQRNSQFRSFFSCVIIGHWICQGILWQWIYQRIKWGVINPCAAYGVMGYVNGTNSDTKEDQ